MACSSCSSCGSCGNSCSSCGSCGGCSGTDYCNGCVDPIYHGVVLGETFYSLAERYGTTVECIISQNPGVAPLNLLVGTVLKICRNSHYTGCGCNSGCNSGCSSCGSGCNSCGSGCSGWVPY
ncbi:MAG: LysM peptidoglycan-binding domain-containing protein [Ruminococcus sp.]|nr:LysM peptidoglycan-binding domain-containing protein [Ruminococcus sp.]